MSKLDDKTLAERLGLQLAFTEASAASSGRIRDRDAKLIADILTAVESGAAVFEGFRDQFTAAYQDGLRQAREREATVEEQRKSANEALTIAQAKGRAEDEAKAAKRAAERAAAERPWWQRILLIAISLCSLLAWGRVALASVQIPSAFVCNLSQGYTWAIEKKKIFKGKETKDVFNFTLVIDNHHSGRFIGNNAASDVQIIETLEGLHFLEMTPSGNITTTTIFLPLEKDNLKPWHAVHSRHINILDPIVSQYVGVCTPRFQ
jgi:hypothetical protein